MYAIFEEVIGPQPPVSFPNTKGSHQQPEDEQQEIVLTTTDTDTENNSDHSKVSSHYASSKPRSKRSFSKQRIYGSQSCYPNRHSSTLPRSNRRRLYSSSTNDSNDIDDTASISSSNPLLDTISVLTYDPPDDSDDYYDLNDDDEFDECKRDKTGKSSSTGPEGDRDSIGYAGSSSIDSGYKSFCPTPEIPDPSIYGPEVGRQTTNTYSGFYADGSSTSQGRSGKPRIMMGTKVISRQGYVSPLRESTGSRRSDSSLYDVNLDHLMYLRQSLLSAIQKCEFSKSGSAVSAEPNKTDTSHTSENCGSSNPVNDERYLDPSPVKSSQPSYTKTVRFNTDVKVTTVNPSQPANEASGVNPCRTSADSTSTEQSGQKIQSKSILKDPLCANLRSQLEAGSGDCTLEEEIDSLLYGRAEFYDLESVDDFPCSYVTMIEDKYRSGKTSIAKVRKLKGEKSQEQPPKSTSSVPESGAETSQSTTEDETRLPKPTKDSTASSSTVSISKTAKCRFTEVARCMLEIIEDLQMKKLQPDSTKDSEASECATSASASSENPETLSNEIVNDPSTSKPSNSECYASAAEYHVYEEIDYDFLTTTVPPLPKLQQEVPPPLPVRPNLMVLKPDHQKREPSPPPRKARCPQKRTPGPLNEDIPMEVRNRPKQRGNLYCLFSDQVERRNISRSLEREWRTSGHSDNQEDDYGFKKEFSSM